jgi:prepilin-type N-terminal cleavage/methylation domain-containing protein
MSIIGTNKSFTLIEVMIATSVLAIGSILIYEALFIALDSYNYCDNYLRVVQLMNEKMWQAQENLAEQSNLGDIQAHGEFIEKNKLYNWDLSYSLVDEAKGKYKLSRIDLTLSWQEGRRLVNLSRNAYALFRQKQ